MRKSKKIPLYATPSGGREKDGFAWLFPELVLFSAASGQYQ